MLSKHLKETFVGLTDIYSFLEVFKYFSLKERVRYERINRRWREVLLVQWKSQKVLSFGFRGTEDCAFCSKTDHQVSEADQFPFYRFLEGYREIISRSRNLRALYINTTYGHEGRPPHTDTVTDEEKGQIIRNHLDLLTCLKEWCPVLEHLSLYPIYKADIIPSLASVLAKDRLQCIWIPYVSGHVFPDKSYTTFPLLEGFALGQYSDLTLFPSIRRASIFNINSTYRFSKMSRPLYSLASIARKERISCINFTLEWNIEAYIQSDLLDLRPFSRLLIFSFSVEGYPVRYLHRLKLPSSVINLRLFLDTDNMDEDTCYLSLMLKSLLNLQSLSLEMYGKCFHRKDKVLPVVTECSPRLRKLYIRFLPRGYRANIGLIVTLTRLREVYMIRVIITNSEINLLLEKCPKIRWFSLIVCDGYSRDVVIQSFKTYSEIHPKRHLQIRLAEDFQVWEGEPISIGNLRVHIGMQSGP